MNRRNVLLGGGVTLSAALAGCSGNSDENGDEDVNGTETEPENEGMNGDESESDVDTEKTAAPSISVTGATLRADHAEPGESIDIDIDLENSGGADGEITLALKGEGALFAEWTEAVDATSEQTVTKTLAIRNEDAYELTVNGVEAGTLTIEAPARENYTYEGSGATVIDGIDIADGLTVVDALHTGGSSNFQVSLENDSQYDGTFVNAIGEYDGASAMLLDSGEYVLDVEADGDWMVEIRQPRATSGDALPQSLSGTGSVVAGPFEFSGSHIATGSHSGKRNFHATIFPENGMFGSIVFNASGEYEGETTFDFHGIGWIDIGADGDWSLAIE